MAFPDDRDRRLIAYARRLEGFAAELADWSARYRRAPAADGLLGSHVAAVAAERRPADPRGADKSGSGEARAADDESSVEVLRRDAANLLEAAQHPPAAAVYGPSQSGKSLFADRLLAPRDPERSPLGRDESHGAPGYLPGLSFNVDLNPQSGSNEATALVTRFTAGDRMPDDLPPQYPVVARALGRGGLLRALARGFAMECAVGPTTWNTATLDAALEEIARRHPAAAADTAWVRDLAATYFAIRAVDPRRFVADEAALVARLNRIPLTSEGYTALAARLFWDDWRSLSGLFLRVDEFLSSIRQSPGEAGELLVGWGAARFLLDGKRALVHERRGSRCFPRVEWSDIRLVRCGLRPALEYCPGSGAYREPLETIQAAMLELVVPVLPARLEDEWRLLLERSDVLDIPGLRAGRQGADPGKRRSADTLDEQLEILKRGKVACLFEHYAEQLQIQTLLLLVRGGNLEVTASLKHHVDYWGRARYGAEAWPRGVVEKRPALFVGLTGLDEEFRHRSEFAESSLYDTRIAQLTDALGDVAAHFGGDHRPLTNLYPLRYPGLWDASAEQREREGAEKWNRAGAAFLASGQVRRHVDDAAERWAAALADDDGGWRAVRRGLLEHAATERKQDHLEAQLRRTHERLAATARRWIVSDDGRAERTRRLDCAQTILDWLSADARHVGDRVEALRVTLCLREGDQYPLSDALDDGPSSQEERDGDDHSYGDDDRFGDAWWSFWRTWAEARAVCWDRFTRGRSDARSWPGPEEIGRLSTYLKDYFCSPAVRSAPALRLLRVVGASLRDEYARREARRRYVRLLVNDLIWNPGLMDSRHVDLSAACDRNTTNARSDHVERNGAAQEGEPITDSDFSSREFGRMTPLVRRWKRRLPQVLAGGIGDVIEVPLGNDELIRLARRHAAPSDAPVAG